MRALVLTHVDNEGPGLFGGLLAQAGVEACTVRLHRGERIPPLGELDAAISMGGPMNVYEELLHPFLRDETDFLRAASARGLPVLGICLGAQLIAKAAGAAVTKNPVAELGWETVTLTEAGLADPLFRGLPRTLPVFQWHGDTFAIPAGGALLATGEACRNQAVRYASSWGLQFHLEADRASLADWFAGTPHEQDVLRGYDERAPQVSALARGLFENFLEISRRAR